MSTSPGPARPWNGDGLAAVTRQTRINRGWLTSLVATDCTPEGRPTRGVGVIG